VIHIEKDIKDQMKKLAEIFYRQYIIHLRNGEMNHIEKVTNNFGKGTDCDITKIKERVK
jgi:hypothetical protein